MYNFSNLKNNHSIGYSQDIKIDGIEYFCEFALKKVSNRFFTYSFCVDIRYLDTFEDYAIEEILEFYSIDEALKYLTYKGANIELLAPMKGQKFF